MRLNIFVISILVTVASSGFGNLVYAVDAVHVVVPLADNENQNIAAVPKMLGDGRSLQTNLYWGAAFGLKNFLRKSSKFVLVGCKKMDEQILERCEFKHKKTSSVVVLDAYAGDQLKLSLNVFFGLSGGNSKTVGFENQEYDPSLIVFSGHNGLMDYPWKIFGGVPVKKAKKVAILACQSKLFFKPSFLSSDIKPVIVTKSNMAPEGYILEQLLDGYFDSKSNEEIKMLVAKAYAKYQKISLKAALTVFDTTF